MTVPRANGRYALPRPFLKWVGGKGQLMPELMKRVEMVGDFGRYHEPFLGGGALFFELYRAGALKKQAYLSDNNPRLIEAYEGVRDHVDEVIDLLQRHAKRHSEEHFYRVRAKVPPTLPERAARVIYLNKTCYNGLYRENSKGEFNSPFGRYKKPVICDEDNLRAASKALKKAKIESRHFQTVANVAERGDLVYFDPPYHPVSETSSFQGYHKGAFGEDSQRLLSEVYAKLATKDVHVLLSNSMTDLVQTLYKGFTIDTVHAARAMNSRADRRGKVREALVRNF
jgi:DNA adenine methylase